MKNSVYRYVVVFATVAGTHFRRAQTVAEVAAIADELFAEGHEPRVIDLRSGRQMRGPRLRQNLGSRRKAA
jgi:hypothetical protein